MSTRLSTESGDERCPQKVDAARKGSGSHQNRYSMPSMRHHASGVSSRTISNLSAAQLSRKRKNDREAQRAIRQRTKAHIERLEQRNRELQDMVGLLKVKLAAKNAADNNVSFGMPMDLGQNMGANMTNMKWAIDTDKNMTGIVSASGNETSTGDIYNVDEEGGYQDSAFGRHFTQHPWACLNVSSTTVASGNLYTTDLINSFYGELRAVPQIPPPDAYLQRRNETHMLLFDTPSVQSMSDDNFATITTVVSYPNTEQLQ